MSGTVRASSGLPFFFRSSQCNVPGQFRVGCLPSIKSESGVFAQDLNNFDSNKPLFNKDAFESISDFNFFYGAGPRISNVRGFQYHNMDFAIFKQIRIQEKLKIQYRVEFFNLWNWHIFNESGSFGDSAFTTDLANPDFGKWNGGSVSPPRNIQMGIRIEF